jgi:hypothetical protein
MQTKTSKRTVATSAILQTKTSKRTVATSAILKAAYATQTPGVCKVKKNRHVRNTRITHHRDHKQTQRGDKVIYLNFTSTCGRTCAKTLALYKVAMDEKGKVAICPFCTKPPLGPFPALKANWAKELKKEKTLAQEIASLIDAVTVMQLDDEDLTSWLQPGEVNVVVRGQGSAEQYVFFLPAAGGLQIGRGRRPGFCDHCAGRFNLNTNLMNLTNLT